LIDRAPRPAMVDLDTFRVAIGFALLSGALAIVLPFLGSLTVALAAIAVAGWAWGRPRRRAAVGPGTRMEIGLGWCAATAGAVAFALLPPPWAVGRGLALALGMIPLWWFDRGPRSSVRQVAVQG
jgi:hypothetical protein